MDVQQIEELITPRTKAIMVVHIYGLPVNMDPVLEIKKKYGLYLIEDAAELLGQTYNGQQCGSFGDISTFSFYPNKHVTTGEGGMVLVNDSSLAERCRSLRDLCFESSQRFLHSELGWNYRMSNLQAAIGVAQLERLNAFVMRKRAIGKQYSELLADVKGLQLPLATTPYSSNIYWVYGVVVDKCVDMEAKELIHVLAEHGIGSRPFFWPMHEQPVFNNMGLFTNLHMPVAENFARKGLYLPSGLALSDTQIIEVAETVRKVLKRIYR
jgi:perosamine synthetase